LCLIRADYARAVVGFRDEEANLLDTRLAVVAVKLRSNDEGFPFKIYIGER
jgi:hypothetical protein